MYTIASVTPTICDLFGIEYPFVCSAEAFSAISDGKQLMRVKRVLIFAPDALGANLVLAYESEFKQVLKYAPVQIKANSVMPTVTPVCFASMFTGALPETHGIRKYEKPVLACDTLFDAMARAGKRAAIVAVRDSSIDRIFRNRQIDYFSESYDQQTVERALQLISRDQHDLILVYQQEYDDQMHATHPRSVEAQSAIRNHIRSFEQLASTARHKWKDTSHLLAFLPDHGAHIEPLTGHGTHGSDLPDDLEVSLFWGLS